MSSRSGIQLCYPFSEDRLRKWGCTPYLIQPKLDGDRCRAIIDDQGSVTLLSSTENTIYSVPHIAEELQRMGLRSVELDGELYKHSMSHQEINGIVSRTVNLHAGFEDIEFHVFDIVSTERQADRLIRLGQLLKPSEHIKLVRTDVADDLPRIMQILDAYMDQGYEGIIVRHLQAPYVRKRSVYVMKYKPYRSDYYLVVGYEEEYSIYKEPKNSLGALWLKAPDVDERFKVGTGPYLTRDMRKQLWDARDTLIGQMAHVKYQHLTERHVPRFPVLFSLTPPNAMFKN